MTDADRVGEFGAISPPALQRIRNLWLDREPLVADTGYGDLVDPTELFVELTDGLGDADGAQFDIQWSELGNYSFHYVDSAEVNWRFDRHPNTHSPETHFHPPPDASTAAAEPSHSRRGGIARDACGRRDVASGLRERGLRATQQYVESTVTTASDPRLRRMLRRRRKQAAPV
jgi:hypothetical protein